MNLEVVVVGVGEMSLAVKRVAVKTAVGGRSLVGKRAVKTAAGEIAVVADGEKHNSGYSVGVKIANAKIKRHYLLLFK